jgi:hypothetical protein
LRIVRLNVLAAAQWFRLSLKQGESNMRMGLAANALHHDHDDAALFRWLRACERGIRELNLHLHAVGRTHAAIERSA